MNVRCACEHEPEGVSAVGRRGGVSSLTVSAVICKVRNRLGKMVRLQGGALQLDIGIAADLRNKQGRAVRIEEENSQRCYAWWN